MRRGKSPTKKTLVLVYPSKDEIIAYNMRNPLKQFPSDAEHRKWLEDRLSGEKHNSSDTFQIAPKWGTLVYKLFTMRSMGPKSTFSMILRDPNGDPRDPCTYKAYNVTPRQPNPNGGVVVLRENNRVEFKYDVTVHAINPYYTPEERRGPVKEELGKLLSKHTQADMSGFDALVRQGRGACHKKKTPVAAAPSAPAPPAVRFSSQTRSPAGHVSRVPTPHVARVSSAPRVSRVPTPAAAAATMRPPSKVRSRRTQWNNNAPQPVAW